MRYETELLTTATMQDQLDARVLAGWRLVTIVAHPFLTSGGAPQYVSFWEHD